jgi:5'-3' exonuclease
MNLVIDGNAFLNVASSIVKNILLQDKRVGEKYYVSDLTDDDKFILKQASKDSFRSFSLNYFGSILAPFKDNISSVFFVFDSKSWRRQYIKEHFEFHGEGDFAYKGNRKYDEKIYLFFDYFQQEILPSLAEEYGVIHNRVLGAEGDDLIAYICENIQEDICIWSVDKDLIQLLESEKRKVILITPKMMTKFKKIYTTEDFDKIEPKPVDLFNLEMSAIDNTSVINVLHDLTKKDYKHFPVDPTLEILTKFLGGDGSDNIPRIHAKMTASKITKTLDRLKELYEWNNIKPAIDSNDPAFIDLMINSICESLKINDPGERQTIQNNLSRNKTIIRLHTNVLPEKLRLDIQSAVRLESRRRFDYVKFKKNYKQ